MPTVTATRESQNDEMNLDFFGWYTFYVSLLYPIVLLHSISIWWRYWYHLFCTNHLIFFWMIHTTLGYKQHPPRNQLGTTFLKSIYENKNNTNRYNKNKKIEQQQQVQQEQIDIPRMKDEQKATTTKRILWNFHRIILLCNNNTLLYQILYSVSGFLISFLFSSCMVIIYHKTSIMSGQPGTVTITTQYGFFNW